MNRIRSPLYMRAYAPMRAGTREAPAEIRD